MSEKIFVDAAQSGVIKFRDGRPDMVTPTLQEAVIAFHKLTSDEKALAFIQTDGGKRFEAVDIERLHYK